MINETFNNQITIFINLYDNTTNGNFQNNDQGILSISGRSNDLAKNANMYPSITFILQR